MTPLTVIESPVDDTTARSRLAHPAGRRLPVMTLITAPELSAPAPTVTRSPLDPSDHEIAAKKSRRRLSAVRYSARTTGSFTARYFSETGYDAYGYDADGNYCAAERVIDAPTPFPHH